MAETRQRPRRPQLPLLPGEGARYVPCGECTRCTAGTGQPAVRAGDCWDWYLNEATRRLA